MCVCTYVATNVNPEALKRETVTVINMHTVRIKYRDDETLRSLRHCLLTLRKKRNGHFSFKFFEILVSKYKTCFFLENFCTVVGGEFLENFRFGRNILVSRLKY